MIREVSGAEMEEVARLFTRIRRTCLPWLPPLHTAEEDVAFFRDEVPQTATTLVSGTHEISGFCSFRDGWVDHLYVAPECQGSGVGSELLEQACREQPTVRLYVFTRNGPARRFYKRHGFQIEAESDGERNEEREPDLLMIREHPPKARLGEGDHDAWWRGAAPRPSTGFAGPPPRASSGRT